MRKESVMTKRKMVFFLFGITIAFSVHAATPASKTYLNNKMAVIQAEIDAIKLRVYGG
jgi:hypothetical protein